MSKRRRQHRIALDLSDEERALVQKVADLLGISMQAVLRMALRKMAAETKREMTGEGEG